MALSEFRPLAEAGSSTAQTLLGFMYWNGQGVPQDHAEAVKWYRKATKYGYAAAQNNLGVMYERGQGVPQDYAEALKWYRRAAAQGHALAQHTLGLMYAGGQGVTRDFVEALKWFDIAASRLPQGQEAAKIAELRDLLAKDMTPAQIAEAERLAREWKPKTK